MKVLVVDDDVVSRMVLMHLIDSVGTFDIVEAEDGQDAWQQLEDGLQPAICFCDLRMPRLSGMELLARVKAGSAQAAMPFILVSSASDTATVQQATGLGAAGYIVKPFEAAQVREHLGALADPAVAAANAHLAEKPLATAQRLGISGERLLVYLGRFQSQLAVAGADIDTLLASGDHGAARLRIERLHAGCVTLGLTGAAVALTSFGPGPLDPEEVHIVLADVMRAAMHQSDEVKRVHAAM